MSEMSYIGHFQSDLPRLRSVNKHNTIHDMFSLCFADDGGFMTLGGFDSSTHRGPLCYTPFSSLSLYYRIAVSSVFFDTERAYLNANKWNTYLLLPSSTVDEGES